MKLTFYGGVQSVTGANYLIEDSGTRLLIDCGLFQGSKFAEDLNYQQFSYDPAAIDAVFITHSHADHSGRIAKLYKDGFKGPIYGTEPTVAMMKIALPDNYGLMIEESARDGHPPLYSEEDLNQSLSLCHKVRYNEPLTVGDFEIIFHDAGHILGSSIIEIRHRELQVYFSGDLGNQPMPLLKPFEYPIDADYIITESTYGDRLHEDQEMRKEILRRIIKKTIGRGGTLMIPTFAMERTQELLFELNNLVNDRKIPPVPIFLDSPLAIRLTEVYKKYSHYFNAETAQTIKSDSDIFSFPGLKTTISVEESKKINDIQPPKVIIAGSGMSQGGRILHHERRYLSDPHSAILFIGYQAEGSLGRRILDGAKEVKIFGEMVRVDCVVEAIGGYSAHADQAALLQWISEGAKSGKLKKVFVVQGEPTAADILAEKIKESFSVEAVVPDQGSTFEL